MRHLTLDARPLRRRDFRLLWLGQAVSFLGSRITLVALPYQVYQLTHSVVAVGLLGLFELVPLLAVALLGGAIADAHDRRRLLLVATSGELAVSVVLTVNALLPHPSLAVLYAMSAAIGGFSSITIPALRSALPMLVPQEEIAAATSLETVYGSGGMIAGTAVAGVLIAAIGLPGVYALDAVSFLAALGTVLAIAPIPPHRDAERVSLRAILQGLAVVRRTGVLKGIFLVDSFAMVFGMPSALFPAIAAALGKGPSVLGLLYAAPSVGALLPSLVSGALGRVRRQGVGVIVGALSWGAAIIGFGLVGSLTWKLIFLGLAGAGNMVSAVWRSTILLAASPEHMRGRLTGIEWAQVASAPALGDAEAGIVAGLTSVRTSITSGGVACVVAVLLVALAVHALREYRAPAAGVRRRLA